MSQYGPIFGLVIGGFGEVNDNMDVLVTRLATRAAESKWRLMGALSLAQARQTFKARIRRTIGVEAARGLARLRLANLVNVHSFQRSESAASLRQREKSYYYDARETHYNRASRMVRPRYAGSHPPVTIRCYDLYTYVISILQYNRERVYISK